jgi:SAM-dependent methyltransferase
MNLSSITTIKQFQEMVKAERPEQFLMYERLTVQKQVEVSSLFEHLKLKLHGKRCLDIGPGHGECLEFMHDAGASECGFIERDEWFYTFNALRPYAHGWHGNHLYRLPFLPQRHWDVVFSRGAIAHNGRYLRLFGRLGLRVWLAQIHHLVAPGGIVIFCPYLGVTDWMWLVLRGDYKKLVFIEGHNTNLYPVTMIRHYRAEQESEIR